MNDKQEIDPRVLEFERALADNKEETVQRYLEDNIELLLRAFGDGWAVNECIPKFRFGAEYVSDFVIITGQSYNYGVALVELEPSTERPFTNAGTYARRLNGAVGQIQDWLDWIHRNDRYFRQSLYDKMCDSYGAHQILEGARMYVTAKIVIGRRDMLSEDDDRRRATIYEQHQGRLDILPYDRLIERMCEPDFKTRLRNRFRRQSKI